MGRGDWGPCLPHTPPPRAQSPRQGRSPQTPHQERGRQEGGRPADHCLAGGLSRGAGLPRLPHPPPSLRGRRARDTTAHARRWGQGCWPSRCPLGGSTASGSPTGARRVKRGGLEAGWVGQPLTRKTDPTPDGRGARPGRPTLVPSSPPVPGGAPLVPVAPVSAPAAALAVPAAGAAVAALAVPVLLVSLWASGGEDELREDAALPAHTRGPGPSPREATPTGPGCDRGAAAGRLGPQPVWGPGDPGAGAGYLRGQGLEVPPGCKVPEAAQEELGSQRRQRRLAPGPLQAEGLTPGPSLRGAGLEAGEPRDPMMFSRGTAAPQETSSVTRRPAAPARRPPEAPLSAPQT